MATQRLTQRAIQCVDRAIAFRGGEHPLPRHVHCYRRLGNHRAVHSVIDDHPVGLQRKRRRGRHLVDFLAQQQFEGGVGGLERPAPRFEILDPGRDHADLGRAAGQVQPELACFELDTGPAGHLGHQHAL